MITCTNLDSILLKVQEKVFEKHNVLVPIPVLKIAIECESKAIILGMNNNEKIKLDHLGKFIIKDITRTRVNKAVEDRELILKLKRDETIIEDN